MWVQWLFFLSKDVINYCYHAMWEHVAVRGAITLWSEPKDMVTVFFFQFVSSPIVLFLAVKQNLSQPKLNLLLLWSRSRRILKERRVKRLLPQSRSGLPSVYMKKAPVTVIKNLLKAEKTNRQWYPKQSDIELQIYTERIYKFENGGKIALFIAW